MASMHQVGDQDPDYQDTGTPRKRQRLIEEGAKEATVKRIETIIKQQFVVEMKNKEKEIEVIDQRIHQVRSMLDRLRACVVATYYGMPGEQTTGENQKQGIINEKSDLHPAVKKVLGQSSATTPATSMESLNIDMEQDVVRHISTEDENMEIDTKDAMDTEPTGPKGPRNQGNDTFGIVPTTLSAQSLAASTAGPSRFHVKKRIVVGNISKYIAPDKREENDPSTHKWMVYVRGPLEEPRIDHFVKKVWFFLHPSYRPNDLVEVSEPPFHLTRRGWGEFPVRVQLHFVDQRNKKVDIIHNLKLDRTYTGLQTLGAETVVDVELDRYSVEERDNADTKPPIPSNDTEGKTESCIEETTIQHSQSQGAKSTDEAEDVSSDAAASQPLTAAQIAARIAAAQQLCSPKIKTPGSKVQPSSLNESVNTAGQNGSKVVPKTTTSMVTTSTGTLSMPPLGPISSSKNNSNSVSVTAAVTTTAKTNLSGVTPLPQPKLNITQTQQAKINPVKSVSSPGSFVMLSSQTTPTTSSLPVTTATGGMTTKVRINQGKVEMSGQTVGCSLLSPGNIPTTKSENIVISQQPPQSSPVVKLTPGLSLPRSTVATPTRPGIKMEVTSPTSNVKSQATIIQSPQPRPQVAMPTAIAMPTGVTMAAPGVAMGTQYFIAAKSTDPNLQGKMILIPHQALVQATGQRLVAPVAQQITAQPVRPRGSTTQIQRLAAPSQIVTGKTTTGIQRIATPVPQGKVQSQQVRGQAAAGRGQTVQVRGAFPIPPGNVILIPQGANIPGIQPGSIVQIQQTIPVSKPQTVTTKTVASGSQRTIASPPAVTRTTVQLTPASGLPANLGTIAMSTQSPTSLIPKTAISLTNQATAAISTGNQPKTSITTANQPTTAMTIGNQPTTTINIDNQGSTAVIGGATTMIKHITPSATGASIIPNVVARSIVATSGSKPVATKLVLTKPVVHTIKPVTTKSAESDNTERKTTPQLIKLTKPAPFLRPVSSAIQTSEQTGASKISLLNVPTAKVARTTKPTTTLIGPRLPVNIAERKLEVGCLATTTAISIDKISSMEELVSYLVKRNPLIKKDRVQHESPYCATSLEQYGGWSVGKQRSAEWQRAAKVRKIILEIIKLSGKWPETDAWSVKRIMVWCRRHGYSVSDKADIQRVFCEICGEVKSEKRISDPEEITERLEKEMEIGDGCDDDDDDGDESNDAEDESEDADDEVDSEDHTCKQNLLTDNGWLSETSFTTCETLLENTEQIQATLQQGSAEMEVDVVNIPENKITIKQEVEQSSGPVQMYLPSTPHAEFVNNACREIGVKLPPIEVTKDTYAPVTEEMLLSAMVEFMNDLMRDAQAVAHGNRTDNRCPGEILPTHIYQATLNQPKYSFLTNKHLGDVAMEMEEI